MYNWASRACRRDARHVPERHSSWQIGADARISHQKLIEWFLVRNHAVQPSLKARRHHGRIHAGHARRATAAQKEPLHPHRHLHRGRLRHRRGRLLQALRHLPGNGRRTGHGHACLGARRAHHHLRRAHVCRGSGHDPAHGRHGGLPHRGLRRARGLPRWLDAGRHLLPRVPRGLRREGGRGAGGAHRPAVRPAHRHRHHRAHR